ncbi:hypothetical protein KP509_06G021500 [Ceratopteris richardii]|uniref:ADP-ribosyl cyclase/cyclic ADP-ribose hydrolase n=2 Tax=Ceratopteris richardii TaxID=49495 RepID=A0A8T2UE33_CERRI|nr:hypothetical protein KP509_06G021500 [Ceratopteris richardii]
MILCIYFSLQCNLTFSNSLQVKLVQTMDVGAFLRGVNSSNVLPDQDPSHERRSPSQKNYDVFICHMELEIKSNVVSVLGHMLLSKGIMCYDNYVMNEKTETKPYFEEAVKESKVYVNTLSPNFATSGCLEEVHQIMSIQSSLVTFRTICRVLLIFYNVEPYEECYHSSGYKLCRMTRRIAEEQFYYCNCRKCLRMIVSFLLLLQKSSRIMCFTFVYTQSCF